MWSRMGASGGGSYVCPRVTDVFVMRRVVKREVLQFIIPRGTKN